MTVRELITKLEKYPENYPIVVEEGTSAHAEHLEAYHLRIAEGLYLWDEKVKKYICRPYAISITVPGS